MAESFESMTKKLDELKDETGNVSSPGSPIMFFFTLTILYAFFTIYNVFSKETMDSIQESTNNSTFIMIYVGLLVMGTYFINLGISKNLCKEQDIQYTEVFFSTLLPWIIVFGILYFALEMFPGWVRPFSNTIGYFVVSFLGVEKVIEDLLNKDRNPTVLKAIENIDKNKSKFINEFDHTVTDFKEFTDKLQAEGIVISKLMGDNQEQKEILDLFKLINIKHLIGKIFWYILAGTLISSISYNYLINLRCEKSLLQAQQEMDALYNDEDTTAEEDADN